MGPYTVIFLINGEEFRRYGSETVPLIPRKGEKIQGEEFKYSVTEVVYDYFLPWPGGVEISIYLEKIR